MLQRIESEYEWALLSDTGVRRARPLSTATVNEASDWDCQGGGELELSSLFSVGILCSIQIGSVKCISMVSSFMMSQLNTGSAKRSINNR